MTDPEQTLAEHHIATLVAFTEGRYADAAEHARQCVRAFAALGDDERASDMEHAIHDIAAAARAAESFRRHI
ncbi:hypothetical protein [Xylanimonas protaetiae]|uniref:hypothetical protein n=1 Tax=Xylanimonas protaetiae TaxID=2509457 RepID=UPI0013ED17BC|nr:hypothetical protein [Xylanimonas protaetiae]